MVNKCVVFDSRFHVSHHKSRNGPLWPIYRCQFDCFVYTNPTHPWWSPAPELMQISTGHSFIARQAPLLTSIPESMTPFGCARDDRARTTDMILKRHPSFWGTSLSQFICRKIATFWTVADDEWIICESYRQIMLCTPLYERHAACKVLNC